MTVIKSRDNPRVKRWANLVTDAKARRTEGRVIIEGPHLVAEVMQAGIKPLALIVSESGLQREEIRKIIGRRGPVVLGDHIFGIVADAETPPGIAAEIAIPGPKADSSRHSVFLEGVQDPSNVGAILRTAAAFGVGEVVLDRGCADPWSPKVLRAGMGAHFKLGLRQVPQLRSELKDFAGTLLCTIPKEGQPLRQAPLDGRLGWIFGAEGKGVSPETGALAGVRITIPMAPGTESINVAATAAICLCEAFNRPGAGCAARAGSS
jgi:RNA methyltransferase, TrmH family